ncbi:MAG: hypothetical protein HZC40_21780 [Chloroflexi bacterium]|nr:hypothetical protein [Chloroflexota bacterium]
MDQRNQVLQNIFLFNGADARANRTGKLTPRQRARLGAARASLMLALAIFVVAMLGSVGVAVIMSNATGAGGGLDGLLVFGAVAFVAILIGIFTSRSYFDAMSSKQFKIAQGIAAIGKINPDAARFELKIGATKIRLVTPEHLAAFEPGVEYRVAYTAGPTPTILSAEVVGTEADADVRAPADANAPDPVLQRHARARPILFVLAALALGIPLVGVAASALPEFLRAIMWGALLIGAIAFVFWALARLRVASNDIK